jgi:hypothetical protein
LHDILGNAPVTGRCQRHREHLHPHPAIQRLQRPHVTTRDLPQQLVLVR